MYSILGLTGDLPCLVCSSTIQDEGVFVLRRELTSFPLHRWTRGQMQHEKQQTFYFSFKQIGTS